MFRFTLLAGALAEAFNSIPGMVEKTDADFDSTPTSIDWSQLGATTLVKGQGQSEMVCVDISNAHMNFVSREILTWQARMA